MPQFTVEATKGGKPVTLRITAESEQAAAEKAMLTGHSVQEIEPFDPDIQVVSPSNTITATVRAADATAAVDDQSVLMVKLAALPGLQARIAGHEKQAKTYQSCALLGTFVAFVFGLFLGAFAVGGENVGGIFAFALACGGLVFGVSLALMRSELKAADAARKAIDDLNIPSIHTPPAPRPS